MTKRLAPVVAGETPIDDLYGPPEDEEAYVLGALSRGEDVDPVLIDNVNEWRFNNDRPPLTLADVERRARSHHGGGAKSGQKTGGGGHPQFFGEHGKFAKAGGKPTIVPLAPTQLGDVELVVSVDLADAVKLKPGFTSDGMQQTMREAAKQMAQDAIAAGLIERAQTDPKLAEALKAYGGELVAGLSAQVFNRPELVPEQVSRFLHISEARAKVLLNGPPEILGARLAAQRHLEQWAATSSDTDSEALATQKIAAEKWGLDSTWVDGKIKTLRETGGGERFDGWVTGPKRQVIEATLDVEYAHTQDVLKKAGITEVNLARGVHRRLHGNDAPLPVSYQLSPLSSWSSSRAVASDFAYNASDPGSILLAKVPTSRVVSTFVTGIGCEPEDEFVVMGSPKPDSIVAHPPTDSFGN